MTDSDESGAGEDNLTDRISDLPGNVLDSILNCLYIGDAVRTSILSRKWRHLWRNVADLIFDDVFVKTISKNRYEYEEMVNVYISTIGRILLLHSGPISKFVLYVPRYGTNMLSDIDSWIHSLSERGVKDLTVTASSETPFKLHSYVFHCLELEHLKIDNFQVKIPQGFRGFSKLKSLQLTDVLISGEVLSALISDCPLLESLSYSSSLKNPGRLVIHGLKLKVLHLQNLCFTSLCLKNVSNLTTFSLKQDSSKMAKVKITTIIEFCSSMPAIENITLDMSLLKALVEEKIPTRSSRILQYHKSLTLLDMDMSSPEHVSFALCILNSSPTLRTMNLETAHTAGRKDEAAKVVEAQAMEPNIFGNLLTVQMSNLMAHRSEILLVKIILSCSPVLETIHVKTGYFVDPQAEHKMIAEMLQFRRASTKAEVVYSKDTNCGYVDHFPLVYDDDSFIGYD